MKDRSALQKSSRGFGLAAEIARKIIELILQERLAVGAHLPKHQFAVRFHVSRSPVRAALELLESQGVVEQRHNRGFFLVAKLDEVAHRAEVVKKPANDEPYMRLAADRLSGKLPEDFTEMELMRRYGFRRVQLSSALARMSKEGWVERKPGYGWKFLPTLTSNEAHAQSYRFRMAIEPAAILDPAFRVDEHAFAQLRAEQQRLVEGGIRELSSAELFEMGSRFHETIARCSGNPFFHEAMQRVDRLRRLMEYRAMLDTERFLQQAHEHLTLLDLLESGERERAADFMRRHLDVVHAVKLEVLRSSSADSVEKSGRTAGARMQGIVEQVHF